MRTATFALVLTIALGACASSPVPAPSAVTIRLFAFTPARLDIAPGTAVGWTQEDNTSHTVTSGALPKPDGRFASGSLTQGRTFSFTFEQEGAFPYFCSIHDSMRGEVRVS